jgi:fatty aldehyde-generating acyl-ACP reductase
MNSNKFACIGHPMNVAQFRAFVNTLRAMGNSPEKEYKDQLLIKLFEWTPAFKIKDLVKVGFSGSAQADGIVVMAPFLPEMRDIKLREVSAKIEAAIAIAAAEGCGVAALGGFTSIVLQGREEDVAAKYGIKLTSGNSLTAAIIIRSIERIATRFGVDLSQSCLAIVGASGDIGSGVTGYFCDKVRKCILTARGMDMLKATAAKYSDARTCEFELLPDTRNREAVARADIVVCVTSAYQEILTLTDFRPHTIVCDASFPMNVKVGGALRPDVFIYHGGVVSLPFDIDVGLDIGLASTRTFYGCQVEGICIALNPELPCSWGRGNISREKLRMFLSFLDKAGGIEVSFSTGNREYTEEEMAEYEKCFNCSAPSSCASILSGEGARSFAITSEE